MTEEFLSETFVSLQHLTGVSAREFSHR